ncbi:MAG: hypothetical protein V3R25_10125 [Nitrosomonadaceae bacterium]
MKNEHFRALMDLAMCSDPWPVEDDGENQEEIINMMFAEANNRGYAGWIDAYHNFEA